MLNRCQFRTVLRNMRYTKIFTYIYSFILSERCMEALSSIKRQRCGSSFSSFWINFTSFQRNSTKWTEVIVFFRFAAITLPEVVMVVTKDYEFLNHILLMICSIPLGIQLRFFFVSREKEVSCMFISNSNLPIIFHNFIDNHCLIRIWNSSLKFINLTRPFLYLIPNTSFNIFLIVLSWITVPVVWSM